MGAKSETFAQHPRNNDICYKEHFVELGVGVIGYEVGTDTWDAHTLVNGSLMIGAGVATVFAAPAVLTGIAIYGVGDYFFDFGGTIDRNVGRNSGVWRP